MVKTGSTAAFSKCKRKTGHISYSLHGNYMKSIQTLGLFQHLIPGGTTLLQPMMQCQTHTVQIQTLPTLQLMLHLTAGHAPLQYKIIERKAKLMLGLNALIAACTLPNHTLRGVLTPSCCPRHNNKQR